MRQRTSSRTFDEGAIWVRGTLAPSTGPSEGMRLANQARVILAGFPEVTVATSQVGRPDDGTDTTGFFNTEYFVDLKQKKTGSPSSARTKEKIDRRHESRTQQNSGVMRNSRSPSPTTWKQPSAVGEGRARRQWLRPEGPRGERRADCRRDAPHSRYSGSRPLPRAGTAQSEQSPSTATGASRATRSTWPMCRTPSRPR